MGDLVRTEYLHRNASGGGSVHATLAEALAAQTEHETRARRPAVDEPPAPASVGIFTREVTEWQPVPASGCARCGAPCGPTDSHVICQDGRVVCGPCMEVRATHAALWPDCGHALVVHGWHHVDEFVAWAQATRPAILRADGSPV